ncbi:hypothetical protein TNCV_4074531 [Trichonephila clavipes]|uniref:Uncharacterized protein n=1 Tax=Trichonephila clavipes TaxID=2585209 RepID=A0A8X6W8B4_TRICX|nr:hypothetical protein TNCV_4074531 [Trichonephila clavipes]
MTSFGATNIVRENLYADIQSPRANLSICRSLPLLTCRSQVPSNFFMANSDEQIEQRCHYNAGTRRETGVIRTDKRPVGQHERQFNAPTIDMAIVIVGEEFESRDMDHRRSGDIQRVPKLIAHTTDCSIRFCFGEEMMDII